MIEIPGFYSETENDAIAVIAERLPDNSIIVELGTMFGKSAVAWAEIMRGMNKTCKIYTLDNFTLTPRYYRSRPWFFTKDHLKSIWPFMLDHCSHLDMVKKLFEPYPEIEPVVFDFEKDTPFIDGIDCVYDDIFHNSATFPKCLTEWYERLNKGGIYTGHYCEVKGLYTQAEQMNMRVVKPKDNSMIYYLEHK